MPHIQTYSYERISCVSRFECPRSTPRHKRARACTCSLAARRVRKDSAQDRPNPLAWRRERPLARSLQHGGEHALKLQRSEPSRLALPRRTRLVSSGRRAGDGGRRARSRGPLSRRWHHAHLIIAHLSASTPITKKLSKCRRAPDAQRGCPPVTAVTRASSPFIPEAGAAPRHLSSGGQVGGGPLGPNRCSVPFLLNCCSCRSQT